MFLLWGNFFLVIVPDKFHNFRSRLLHFLQITDGMCKLNCYPPHIISRSLFTAFNTSLSVLSSLFSSIPLISKQFHRQYLPGWSMLSLRILLLTSSFIYYFPHVLFYVCQTLSVIDLTDSVRSANGCSPLISAYLFLFTKFCFFS